MCIEMLMQYEEQLLRSKLPFQRFKSVHRGVYRPDCFEELFPIYRLNPLQEEINPVHFKFCSHRRLSIFAMHMPFIL